MEDLIAELVSLLTGGPRCGNNACVKVSAEPTGDLTFTSTIEGNDGSVTYTAAEFTAFIDDVRAGKYDDVYDLASLITA